MRTAPLLLRYPACGILVQLACLRLAAASSAPIQDSVTARCSVYQTAVATAAESDKALVVDSTMMVVPSFAFSAMTTYSRSERAHELQVSDSQVQALLRVNQHREPIGDCLPSGQAIQPVNSDSVLALFKGHRDGWTRFHRRYVGASRFILVSQPLWLDSSTAFIYVAQASDWLNGAGQILLIERSHTGQWYVKDRTTLWVS